MKTLDRYIAIIFLKNVFISILGVTTIFVFQQLFIDVISPEHPLSQIFYYHFLNIPFVIAQMSSPAMMMATVLTLSGLSRTHELVACYSIGVGLFRIMTVIIIIVICYCAFFMLAQDLFFPKLHRLKTSYYWREMKKRPDFFLDIKRDKIWYRSKNMIYNLERFDPVTQVIYGMSLYTFDDQFSLTQVITAAKAEPAPQGWKMKSGSVTLFVKDTPFPMTRSFKEKEVLISESPQDFQEIEKEVDGLRMSELSAYIQRMKNAGADTKSYQVKYHSRMSMSFTPLVMCFLAVPFSLATRRSGGFARDLGICLGITFLYWLFYSVGLSFGKNGSLSPWLSAWLPSGVFGLMAVILISRKRE